MPSKNTEEIKYLHSDSLCFHQPSTVTLLLLSSNPEPGHADLGSDETGPCLCRQIHALQGATVWVCVPPCNSQIWTVGSPKFLNVWCPVLNRTTACTHKKSAFPNQAKMQLLGTVSGQEYSMLQPSHIHTVFLTWNNPREVKFGLVRNWSCSQRYTWASQWAR